MSTGKWRRAAVVGLVGVSLAACAHKESAPAEQPPPAPTPAPQAVQQPPPQPPSLHEQLGEAKTSLETADRDIAAAQQQLAAAQRRQEQARARVQQLEIQARQDLDRARQLAYDAEQAQGLRAATGRVAEATPSRVLLHLSDGRTMAFQVDERTRVLVGSEPRSVADIQQGADARVAYEPKGDQQTAITIRIAPVGRDMGVSPASPPSSIEPLPSSPSPQR
jgi:hypothetical protein